MKLKSGKTYKREMTHNCNVGVSSNSNLNYGNVIGEKMNMRPIQNSFLLQMLVIISETKQEKKLHT